MKVEDLGEFGLIERLTNLITRERMGPDNATPFGIQLTVDAGDDTAVWSCGPVNMLYTTDTVVEGVHFTRASTPWHDLGWKAMAANVSDIAAMGGRCLYALITLGLPPDTDPEDLESLYQGMIELGNKHGVAIVGGDVVRSPTLFVTVGLTGATDSPPMLRSNAKPGDLVGVTGFLGSSAGGLEILLNDLSVQGEDAEYLKAAHRRPEPCIIQGNALALQGVTAAMDISDGLVDDLSKLCRASGVSARLDVEKIPLHPALKQVFPQSCLSLALGGGEDYQLLFTAPAGLMEQVLTVITPPATVIGEIIDHGPQEVVVVDSNTGDALATPYGGWDHFKGNPPKAEG